MALTTATKVRQRLGLQSWEGSDTAIAQFITDGEATIYAATGHTYTAADDDYALAQSVCTGLAAQPLLLALINPPESKPDPAKSMLYLQSLPELVKITAQDLALLVPRIRLPSKEIPLARNTVR